MSERLLSSSSDSLELSITENNNETFDSYSLLFDKAKHNFSTSSEISFIKNDSSPTIDHNQTVTQQISTRIDNIPTEESENFNPWLLLFTQNDEQQTNQIETEIYDDNVTRWANPRQDPLDIKTVVRDQQHQSKR